MICASILFRRSITGWSFELPLLRLVQEAPCPLAVSASERALHAGRITTSPGSALQMIAPLLLVERACPGLHTGSLPSPVPPPEASCPQATRKGATRAAEPR